MLKQIEAARERICNSVYYSPCRFSAALSQRTGSDVFLKIENLQTTGSFKDRGALNRILTLSEDERRLLAAQRLGRVESTRTPRGNVSRQQRNRYEQQHHPHIHPRRALHVGARE